ncbi:hypothetical protein [Methylogaea oryzae]|uniref:hypothetical protein n=1 Tax=Methylogaea oryzae TaxID=1295382 RepID=UPI0020D13933|nr:hypothetical protein [Methylogaea oryzae]
MGIVVTRRIRNESDYLLAGRSIGFGLGTFTVFATWFGAETCIGAAGAIYENGLSGGSADPFATPCACSSWPCCSPCRCGGAVSPPWRTCSTAAIRPAWSAPWC